MEKDEDLFETPPVIKTNAAILFRLIIFIGCGPTQSHKLNQRVNNNRIACESNYLYQHLRNR